MNTTDSIHTRSPEHLTAVDAGGEVLEATGAGLRLAEVGLVVLIGLLVCPPLLILAVIVAVPAIAVSALIAAVVAAVAVPTFLVRRVRAHHRAHGTTLFLHRLRR